MTGARGLLEELATGAQLAAARCRALVLRLRGAQLGPKVSIGPRCSFRFPWQVSMGTRATLEADVCIKLAASTASVALGEYVFLGHAVRVDCLESVSIGAHTVIAPGCFITDHNHGTRLGQFIDSQQCAVRPVRIGADCWLGHGVTVLAGVSIGDGAVVGAGAVVSRDVPANAIAVGVPARVTGHRKP